MARLALTYNGVQTMPVFNDGTILYWNPTRPVDTAQCTQYFADTPCSLPETHADVQVLTDGATHPLKLYNGATVPLPPGPVSLRQLMSAVHEAVTATAITEGEYAHMTGVIYDKAAHHDAQPTLAIAMADAAMLHSYSNYFHGIAHDQQGGLVAILT